MGKLSDFQLSHIVALQKIYEGIDEEEVKYHLNSYGPITNVQFWVSNNGNRHGFVTFQDPEAARRCLDRADEVSSVLSVKPVNPGSIVRYRIPPRSPKRGAKSIIPADAGSPSLITRMSQSQPVTPTRQPLLQLKDDSGHAAGASGLLPRPPSPTQPVESPLTSNGILLQQRKGSMANTSLQRQQSLSTRPSLSESGTPGPPAVLSAPHQAHDRDDTASEDKGQGAENTRLKHEIQKLHSILRNIKISRDSALEDVTEKAHRYKKERDNLSFDVEAANKSAKYYKTLSEDLKRDLTHERKIHQDKERVLQHDLHSSSKEVSDFKKHLEIQSRVLSQRALELSQSRQELRAMNLKLSKLKSRFSEKGDTMSDVRQETNISEPEEGQVDERRPGPSNSPSKVPSRRHTVLPALEKAFIYLEELTNAALLEAQPVDERGSNAPNKRQRLDDA